MEAEASWTQAEMLACIIARELRDGETVGVGAASPVPAAAALLARASHAPTLCPLIIGSPAHFPFRGGSKEFFDFAQRGGLDVFFLSGAQIDLRANINLHCIGPYEAPSVRLPGARGSAMLYYMARRTILFRTEHTPRVFVPRVDFITSPGASSAGVFRRGGPDKVITPLLTFRFNQQAGELELAGLHPGVSLDAARAQTGFPLRWQGGEAPRVAPPTAEELAVLRERVRDELAPIYPRFAAGQIKAPHAAQP
ncbi:MAG: CoA synthetase [Candidatus Tectomicrobia bacterium]|nr:CoA synthetase [Candidatus Tectomicrobia bacterium]